MDIDEIKSMIIRKSEIYMVERREAVLHCAYFMALEYGVRYWELRNLLDDIKCAEEGVRKNESNVRVW